MRNLYTYQKFAELKEILTEMTASAPEVCRLETIGTSHRGREIFLVTVTDFSCGRESEKNAFYADACTHAEEFAGCNTLLSLTDRLIKGYRKDPVIQQLLKERVFYIVPRLNPDGIEFALEGHPWCGNGRNLPDEAQMEDGFYWDDIDHNGIVAQMRVEDPDGEWKISQKNPRLMTLREPFETGGTYYRLYPEGRIRGEVKGARFQKPKDGNINRNYPGLWTPEGMQYGAGETPMSEPETKAAVDFITAHKNIAMVFSMHTCAGVILRPFIHQSDKHFKGRDLHMFEELGKIGTDILDYPVISVFEEFTPDAEDVRGGTLTDWAYAMMGIPSIVVEQWNLGKESGCGISDPYPPDYLGEDAEIKVLEWAARHYETPYLDWKEYDHPELGKVEIGGWNRIRVFRNPPEDYLEDLSVKTADFALKLSMTLPKIVIRDAVIEEVKDGIYKVEAVIRNAGWLPTYISAQSMAVNNCEPLQIRLETDAEILCATDEKTLPHLEGRFGRESEWSQWIYPWDPNEKKVTWIIQSDKQPHVTVIAGNNKCGTARLELM